MIKQRIPNFKLRLALFFILFLFKFNAISQNGSIIPPSPTSAALSSLIDFKGASFQGNSDMSIDLGQMAINNMKIDVKINYVTGGIKYDQQKGEIGLGWVLTSNYRISREIMGLPDESAKFQTNYFDSLQVNAFNFAKRDKYLGTFIDFDKQDIPYHGGEIYDAQYDIFSYETLSGSGKFFIDFKNGIVKNLSGARDKIQYFLISGKLSKLLITDENGILYTYGRRDDGTEAIEKVGILGSSHATSWMLLEVKNRVGLSIKFDYTPVSEYSSPYNSSVSFTSGILESGLQNIKPQVIPDNYGADTYATFRLSQVYSENNVHKIIFNRSANPLKELQSVDFLYNGTLLKKHVFIYNDVFLKRVVSQDLNSVSQYEHLFSYIEENNFSQLKSTSIPDFWGFHKFVGSSYGSNFIPQMRQMNFCDFNYDHVLPFVNTTALDNLIWHSRPDRTAADNSSASYFSLNKIQFPSKGVWDIEYENNKYSSGSNIKYAGIRIKNIKKSDNGVTIGKTEYKYGLNENGIGQVDFDIADAKFFVEESLYGLGLQVNLSSAPMTMGRKLLFTSKINGDLSHLYAQQTPVGYSQVAEYTYGSNEIPSGKILYDYNLHNQKLFYPFTTGYISGAFHGAGDVYFSSGAVGGSCVMAAANFSVMFQTFYNSKLSFLSSSSLTKKSVFKYENGFVPIQDKSYIYLESSESFRGLKVRRLFSSPISYSSASDYYSYSNLESLFKYGEYEIIGGQRLLSKEITTNYSNSGTIIDTVSYFYNIDNQVNKIVESGSDGISRSKLFSFPKDYSDTNTWIQKLKFNNLLNRPIEIIDMVNDKIVNGSISMYDIEGKDLLKQQYDLEINAGIPYSNFKFSNLIYGASPLFNTEGTYSPDLRYKLRNQFLLYDTKGRLLEVVSQNKALTTYLWGYGGQYPIAEIKNATYAEVLTVLNQSTIDNLNNPNHTEATMETLIKNAAATLRSDARLSKAMVTNYTYKPLVGMTSKTDARGMTEHYQYDGMQRLKAVLDQFKDITKAIDYHYRPN